MVYLVFSIFVSLFMAWWIFRYLMRSLHDLEFNDSTLNKALNAQKSEQQDQGREVSHMKAISKKERINDEDKPLAMEFSGGQMELSEDLPRIQEKEISSRISDCRMDETVQNPYQEMRQLSSTEEVESQTGSSSDDLPHSTDSEGSFQIVNRPSEFELMNEDIEGHASKIVRAKDPSNVKTSLFSRVTDTLRRRIPSDMNVVQSQTIQESREQQVAHPTEPSRVESCDMKLEETTHNVLFENAQRIEEKSDHENEVHGEVYEKAEENDDSGSDVSDKERKQEEGAHKRRKEFIRKKIITSVRASRKTECQKRKRRGKSKLPNIDKIDDKFRTVDDFSDDDNERIVSENSDNEWDESDDDTDELDLSPDLELAEILKTEGNTAFKNQDFDNAIKLYNKALVKCSYGEADQLISVLLCNRGACYLSLSKYEEVLSDCTDSIEFDKNYVKAYLRRFRANEALEKWHDALNDINKAIELDPSLKSPYYGVQKKVEKLSQEQFEKEKAELMDKLKGFGNWALGKVGLSLDNFKLEQNSETGGYNIQFVQNPNQPKENNVNTSSSHQ